MTANWADVNFGKPALGEVEDISVVTNRIDSISNVITGSGGAINPVLGAGTIWAGGQVTTSNATITGGSIENTPIGLLQQQDGKFLSLTTLNNIHAGKRDTGCLAGCVVYGDGNSGSVGTVSWTSNVGLMVMDLCTGLNGFTITYDGLYAINMMITIVYGVTSNTAKGDVSITVNGTKMVTRKASFDASTETRISTQLDINAPLYLHAGDNVTISYDIYGAFLGGADAAQNRFSIYAL